MKEKHIGHSKPAQEMEPQAEDPAHSPLWSGSEGSQELCPSERLAELYNEDDDSESEDHSGSNTHIPSSQSPECLQLQHRESADGPESLLEQSEQEESVFYQENCDFYFSESRESMTESPYIEASQTSVTSPPECPDSKSWQHSCSSSSSLGCAADMTKVLTLSSERPLGASDGHGPSSENRSVESSEEGGSNEAPPASVFFGISDEGAEQTETRNLGSDRDLCRPDRQRARYTRLSHKESQSERHVKETKSKCKRIAQLLANAPNPQNKGALLFKKRRQRVKKYTLVSYGTGVHAFDSSGQIEGETDKVRSAGYSFLGSSDSDFEEQYFQRHQYHNPALDWESGEDMDVLPETKGKGLLMFEQRRKRIDELVSEQEDERSEGFSEDVLKETQRARIYESKEMYMHAEETNVKKHMDYHADVQEVNHLSTVPKPMVSNRTAKPFLGFQASSTLEPVTMSGGVSPAMKKHELAFKVHVPINSNPKVWSPTGDIIASRDERISVPAIKTGILPESKRKTANKHPSVPAKESELYSQSKGERKSYIESEEDFFSLGAEACNFMQPKPIKLKNPPPVAPKPTINPACPPWNPSSEPCVPSRSPVSHPSHSPIGLHGQHYLQQQDWTQPQQMAGHWASDQTEASLQTPANARVPVNSSLLRLQPTSNSWSQQPSLSPVSKQAHNPTYSPLSHSKNKSDSSPNLVAPFLPPAEKSYLQAPKPLEVFPKLRVPDRSVNQAADGTTMSGKGAKLFAKRQSRMEKFVIDGETVQANKTRSPSPTSSLPNSWRYSSNIRAPPPLSYNPLLSPFYPPSAAKQPPSTSPKPKPKSKEKPKSSPKQLNALDIMKHQPYQLDSSLFTYDAASEAKSPSPKPTPVSKFEVTKSLKQRADSSYSPYNPSEPAGQTKAEAPAKAPKSVSVPNFSTQSTRSAEQLSTDKHLEEKLAVMSAAPHTSSKQAQGSRPASTTSQHSSSVSDTIASAFSPASLIARGVRQMAPRPKFSAKKPAATRKQWKPVAMLSSV
ncbi:synaptopodin-2-like isoform X1 [Xiphophorus maculatus]|uniref:Synaptopodin 2 n=1 Tax=Xiphophorus maculatus TaxID=8083 RepID=A0A3B5RER3_XIPMA|nr:synaptopodin-2-like isoform X1 [Xiphophorus maculatus]